MNKKQIKIKNGVLSNYLSGNNGVIVFQKNGRMRIKTKVTKKTTKKPKQEKQL